jgi:hypothetical protein
MNAKIQFDVKSILLGAALAALLLLGTGATGEGSDPVGRYQVSVGSDGKSAIVDTITGQAWVTQIPNGQVIGTSTYLTVKNK